MPSARITSVILDDFRSAVLLVHNHYKLAALGWWSRERPDAAFRAVAGFPGALEKGISMRAHVSFEVDLARGTDTPRRARQLITERFAAELTGTELETAKLLASELATNAVIHGQGSITVRGHLDENRLFFEVIDEGSGFERAAEKLDCEKLNGARGLKIVEAAASRWGIHEGTTHVWFELERTGGHALKLAAS